MASRIFLNYRRQDSGGRAGRLYDALAEHFGDEGVFQDIDDISAGRDFRKVIEEAVGESKVLLVMIGRSWLTCTDAAGSRRLDSPRDLVRLEVAAGLKRDILVIPVLVDDAEMPVEDELPDDLKELAYRNAAELSDKRWRFDTAQLIKVLQTLVEPTGGAHPGAAATGQVTGKATRQPAAPGKPTKTPTPTPAPAPSARPAGQTDSAGAARTPLPPVTKQWSRSPAPPRPDRSRDEPKKKKKAGGFGVVLLLMALFGGGTVVVLLVLVVAAAQNGGTGPSPMYETGLYGKGDAEPWTAAPLAAAVSAAGVWFDDAGGQFVIRQDGAGNLLVAMQNGYGVQVDSGVGAIAGNQFTMRFQQTGTTATGTIDADGQHARGLSVDSMGATAGWLLHLGHTANHY